MPSNGRVDEIGRVAKKPEEAPSEEAESSYPYCYSSSERNTVSSSESSPTYEFKDGSISVPSTQNRYKIGQFDVSLTFYVFQLISDNNFNTLNIESNVSQVLYVYNKKKLLKKKKYSC